MKALAACTGRSSAGAPYDLVLLDHHMPGRDGLEVGAATLGGRGPRVILLSSAGPSRAAAPASAPR